MCETALIELLQDIINQLKYYGLLSDEMITKTILNNLVDDPNINLCEVYEVNYINNW